MFSEPYEKFIILVHLMGSVDVPSDDFGFFASDSLLRISGSLDRIYLTQFHIAIICTCICKVSPQYFTVNNKILTLNEENTSTALFLNLTDR